MTIKMRKIDFTEYLNYIKLKKEIEIEDQIITLEPIKVTRLQPNKEELTDISTTVWSFPKRGAWGTHKGDYRGNWAPQIPRALMLMYTEPGDLVLDPMVGGGTTIIEAKLLGRNAIGVDINYNAIILTLHRLYYLEQALKKFFKNMEAFSYLNGFYTYDNKMIEYIKNARYEIYHGDAANLNLIKDESIDLIATHPPYFNIIKYGSKRKVNEHDLSRMKKLEDYINAIEKIAKEFYRVLKPGKICAILIGDTRIHKHYVPISHYVLRAFLKVGFILKEEVIKIQHKMKTTREKWQKAKERDFLLIYHEKLFIFRKPVDEKDIKRHKYSTFLSA